MTTTNVPKEPPYEFRVDTSAQGATTTIEFVGEWDLAQRDATTAAIAQALAGRPACLVLDLTRLSFIDSTGVHGLMNARKRCAEQGAQLVILPGPPAVQHVFEVCGLIGLLPFSDQPPQSNATTLRDDLDGDDRTRLR
jgi:anti-sigma B factor antagonist